jgi:hypothetical protein
MRTFSFKKTIARGIALALPLGIVAYIFLRFVRLFEKIISPFAKKFGVESIFGDITLTLLAIIAILVITFLLGLLMQFSFVSNIRKQIEAVVLKVFPSLNHLKLMAAEKLDIENAVTNWTPVLLKKGEEYLPAFIIEEAGEWITLAKVKAPSTEPGDILVTKRNEVSYTQISMKEMKNFNKQFGKGYISVIEKKHP